MHNNRIGGVMVLLLASIAVDCGFEPRSGRIKDFILYLLLLRKHTALRSKTKSKDCLAQNEDNVSERSDMSSC